MNANLSRPWTFSWAGAACLASALAALSGCVPAPERPRAAAPRPLPALPPLSPVGPAPLDWRDAPATPGDWSSQAEPPAAQFGQGLFSVRCLAKGQVIRIERAGTTPGAAPMTISTTSLSRTLTATPVADLPGVVAASLQPRDTLLDAMVFSRGRIAVEVAGMAPLYIPAWPELARVVEDCR
jgi:hypothetical protein